MKKTVSVMLLCILIVSLAGCGMGEKAEEKAAEAVVEDALGQDGVDVDIDGDAMTITREDGQEVTIGKEWPDSELGKSIPKFEKGSIDGVITSPESIMISLFEVKQEDAVAYIEECKPNFPLENTEMNAEGMVSWGGENEAGVRLALTHQDDAFSITLFNPQE